MKLFITVSVLSLSFLFILELLACYHEYSSSYIKHQFNIHHIKQSSIIGFLFPMPPQPYLPHDYIFDFMCFYTVTVVPSIFIFSTFYFFKKIFT
jgi:hypothetical protein